jgi:hypothetical protein
MLWNIVHENDFSITQAKKLKPDFKIPHTTFGGLCIIYLIARSLAAAMNKSTRLGLRDDRLWAYPLMYIMIAYKRSPT